MGNSQTKQNAIPKQWEKVDTDNGLEIYRNLKTQELAERRLIVLDSEVNVDKEIKLYKMRENNNDALVRAFGSAQLSKSADSFVSCAGQNKVFVLTEKMPHRLSQLPQLTFPQSLLFLGESLRAYDKIYREYGPVQVTKEMIGVNYLGEVKSWLNSNWALNHRTVEYNKLRSKKVSQLSRQQYLAYRQQYMDEQQIIKSIISVIQQKCEDGKFPQAFKQQVMSQSGSFKKLLLYLKDFIQYNQIYVPNKINYEELVQVKYPVRLEHQLNFNVQRAQSQVAANDIRPGQNIALINNEAQQGYPNYFSGGQATSQQIQPSSTQQTYSNKSIGYQTTTSQQKSQFPGQQPFIPEPVKESPAASDIGPVTFSQSTRTYNQQPPLTVNYTQSQPSNYQWSASKIDSLYTPTYQNPQQVINPVTRATNYTLGGLVNGQAQTLKYEQYKPLTGETSYQSYSTGYVALGQPTSLSATNPEQNYSYTNNTFTKPTYTTINSDNSRLETITTGTLNTPSFSLANITPSFNNNTTTTFTHSPLTNNNSFAIGSTTAVQTTKGYQNPTSLGYANLNNSINVSNVLPSANKWNYTAPLTTTNYVTETYSYSGPKINTDPSHNTTEKYAGFSFDGKQDLASRFGTPAYTGSGYSNVLTKYQSETSTAPYTTFSQGKYFDAFNSLLGPSLQAPNLAQDTSGQQHQVATQLSRTSNIATINQQKRQSSNISHSNITQTQQITTSQHENNTANLNPLQALSKMVERASNQVSESILRTQ